MRLGRLFWKFFFAFWLALLLAGGGVGGAVWWHQQSEHALLAGEEDHLLLAGPRVTFSLKAAVAVLSRGGEVALRDFLADIGEDGRSPPIFAVDAAGKELLGRHVDLAAEAQARAWALLDSPRRGARLWSGEAGKTWLLFVPAVATVSDRAFGAPSGEPRIPFGRRGPPPPNPWWPILAGLVASVLFSALLAWYLSKPIRSLRWALGAVAEGQLDARVRPLLGRRRDEIADLAEDFDRMARQVQALISSQRRLLHDVSHELRSPLARLQAAIGLVRQDPGRFEATLGRIEREAVRLDDLVGQLLTLARLDSGKSDAPRELADLIDLAAAVADDACFEARALGRELNFKGDGEAEAMVWGELIQRAFENVIRNAVKYTVEGSCVDVHAAREGDVFVLCVEDRGPGVPVAELGAMFEPFYRGGNVGGADGFGLGLAIARRAVLVHGGTIDAANRDGGGLVVEIRLPIMLEMAQKG
ncbi:MAG: ATP-binding protein [Zoogloea sp.]|uniref:sensor histidine kinase n=1 Tax=Zoogloea sp. TaxID=49181 RepID=UPI00262008B2|nr:ATP-binding protein [Zoogloea sp.]MDD2990529.1 ATP-binding protein [Zoogloea sp.]